MNKAARIFFAMAFAFLLGAGFVVPAQAKTSEPMIWARINKNGMANVQEAKITGIASNSINAVQTFGQVQVPWVITIDAATKLTSFYGGTSTLAEFQVGNTIEFQGQLTQGSPLTVLAKTIRNISLQTIRTSPDGIVKTIDATAKTFTVAIAKKPIQKIIVTDATLIMKQNATTTFGAIQAGNRVHICGLWNKTENTIQAELIKMQVDARRIFDGGTVTALPNPLTPPTALLVKFGDKEYSIQIDIDTAIVNKKWEKALLQNFKIGDKIRAYGVLADTVIDATVVIDKGL